MADQSLSFGLRIRSDPNFIISTTAIGLFTDLFLYGIVVPILPFMLRDRFHLPESDVQPYSSKLLAVYSASTVIFSLPAGWLADKASSRRLPYLVGLFLLLAATSLFSFGQSIAVLVVARILQGMSAAVVWSVGFAMVLEAVGKGKMGKVLGIIYSFSTIAELVSPILGGILYHAVGIIGVFGVSMGIIAVDLIMRLLVIENKKGSMNAPGRTDQASSDTYSREGALDSRAHPREDDPLLPKGEEDEYRVRGDVGYLLQTFPILYCFRNPRFLLAMLTSLTQAMIISMFDATIPTEAESLLHFSSLQVGLLFTALVAPCTILGWFFGWVVDKYGTKVVSTTGYGFMVPCLVLLGLPSQDFIGDHVRVGLYCVILSLNGIGLAIINLPGFVEASNVMKKYEGANPTFFGENGSYAQLYGLNSFFFFSGLTVGPLLGAALRSSFGYGWMGISFAILSAVMTVLSYLFMGEK
ncbi:membrane transporter protein [Fusarium avenaceum]|nr:membrane transporter protein [Fusarium avenaceum]